MRVSSFRACLVIPCLTRNPSRSTSPEVECISQTTPKMRHTSEKVWRKWCNEKFRMTKCSVMPCLTRNLVYRLSREFYPSFHLSRGGMHITNISQNTPHLRKSVARVVQREVQDDEVFRHAVLDTESLSFHLSRGGMHITNISQNTEVHEMELFISLAQTTPLLKAHWKL